MPQLLKCEFGIIMVGGLLMVACRHPFVARRLLLMVPTLLIISIGVFVIIQIAPGNFIDNYIQQLEMEGQQASQSEIQSLRKMFNMDDPMPVRYLRWMGAAWFISFEPEDKGLLQGNLGWSMASRQPVNDIVALTLAIPGMILGETSLSFLGLGLRPPVVSWGVLLQDCMNIEAIGGYPWLLSPAILIVAVVLCYNFVGDGLRDAADPYR